MKDFLVAGGGDADRRRSRTGALSGSRAGGPSCTTHAALRLDETSSPLLLPQLASWALLALRLRFLVFCVIVVPKAEGSSSRPGRTAWDKERVSASGTDSKPPLRPSVSTDVSQRSTQRLRSSHGVTDGRHGLLRLESVLPTPRWGPSVPCDSADTPPNGLSILGRATSACVLSFLGKNKGSRLVLEESTGTQGLHVA